MPPGSRIKDGVYHPDAGGPISQGSGDVFTGGKPAARAGDLVVHDDGFCAIIKGSTLVFIDGRPAARILDDVSCGGFITDGYSMVIING